VFMPKNKTMSCAHGWSGASGMGRAEMDVVVLTVGEWNDGPLKNITNRGAPTNEPPAT